MYIDIYHACIHIIFSKYVCTLNIISFVAIATASNYAHTGLISPTYSLYHPITDTFLVRTKQMSVITKAFELQQWSDWWE